MGGHALQSRGVYTLLPSDITLIEPISSVVVVCDVLLPILVSLH